MITVWDLEVTPVTETTLEALMEFHRYGLQGCSSAKFLNAPLEFQNGYWVLETPFVIGSAQIECHDQSGMVQKYDCVIHPDSTKVSHRRDWDQMLRDLYQWWGPYVGKQSVRDGRIIIGHHFSLLVLEALVNDMCTWGAMATGQIQSWLQQSQVRVQSKRITTLTGVELVNTQHSSHFQQALSSQHLDEHIQVHQRTSNASHPVGIYIQELMHRVYNIAIELEHSLTALSQTLPVQRSVKELQFLQNQLDPMIRKSKSTPSVSRLEHLFDASVIVKQFITQGELFLLHQIDLSQTTGIVMQPHSYQVYEFWCFYQLIRLFREHLEIAPTYTNMENESGWGMCVQFNLEDDVLELLYNPKFEAYWNRGTETQHSLVGEQRPDVVIRSRCHWCVLDAKYRSGLNNVLDSFSTAFSYRESLYDIDRGGYPTHSILLMPMPDEQTELWFSQQFIREHHFGCLQFNPVVVIEPTDLAIPWLLDMVESISCTRSNPHAI